jgi:hypothetical protein
VALPHQSRALARLTLASAIVLWLAVLTGTYIIFPPYRATPPVGVTDLGPFPRSLIQSRPDTVWLHAFGMESKEHMPWIAAMLATAVAFVGVRVPSMLVTRGPVRRLTILFVTIALGLIAFVAVMGVFVNKVAPLQ